MNITIKRNIAPIAAIITPINPPPILITKIPSPRRIIGANNVTTMVISSAIFDIIQRRRKDRTNEITTKKNKKASTKGRIAAPALIIVGRLSSISFKNS